MMHKQCTLHLKMPELLRSSCSSQRRGGERYYEAPQEPWQSRNKDPSRLLGIKDKSLILAAFFSLCLHGLLASFLIPFAPKASLERISTIEVVWEKGDSPSKNHSRSRVKSEKSSPTKENRIHKAPSQIKKVSCNPPISQDSCTHGKNEGKKNSSPKPISKMTGNRKAHYPLPDYPWICRKRHQEGMVSLEVRTNTDGRVLEVNLYKSSGHSRLDEVAIEAVKTWTFAEGNQQKVLNLAFRLKDS